VNGSSFAVYSKLGLRSGALLNENFSLEELRSHCALPASAMTESRNIRPTVDQRHDKFFHRVNSPILTDEGELPAEEDQRPRPLQERSKSAEPIFRPDDLGKTIISFQAQMRVNGNPWIAGGDHPLSTVTFSTRFAEPNPVFDIDS
jgi:hypothetical protein